MINSMGQWLSEWAEDAKVTAVVVRGIGKAFCAGMLRDERVKM